MRPLMVSEVNQYIKKLISSDMLLNSIQIEGEISNYTHHYSGHMYFSLKDEKSRIRCVMFNSDNINVNFRPKDGAKVTVTGSISVYEKDGSYQVYVRKMEKQGIGDLYRAFNLLKDKLEKEGLFDSEFKKDLPAFPMTIGVVTSSTGAAIRDIVSILKRRYPPIKIVVYPALVQGDGAPSNIIKGLKMLDVRDDIDLIITGRGGGSMEELFAFNDEKLARCIFGLKTPLISAVGHESDFTIADFVADVRASTPSAAAELAVPDKESLLEELRSIGWTVERIMESSLTNERRTLIAHNRTLSFLSPEQRIMDRKIDLDNVLRGIQHNIEKRLMREERNLFALESRLQIANPEGVLAKGYGIITDHKGNVRKGVAELNKDERLYIRMIDGRADVVVIDTKEDKNGYQ
ncbi:exodeoxyribonuclease VII large subunit [Gudongella sp. DL1XJH-153]|uniref:exodeoxyribonuclease VII large subunit n=1 Tax=Gudongella sp. DL1XJH-153 TaxID=3409804 RepID=UPI003BB5ED82